MSRRSSNPTSVFPPRRVLVVKENETPRPPKPPCGSFQFPTTSPLHLTATTTVQPNSSTGVNAVALKNPNGQPMEILEIKWSLSQSTFDNEDLACVIGCKLDLGNFPLTNGYVPIGLFGRTENLWAEQVSDGDLTICINEFSWKLPRPLYVPADSVLVPVFQHRGLVNADVNVRISYAARTLPLGAPPPKKLALPYAAFYAGKPFDESDSGTDNSVETDLMNPFAEPIIIQRFGGRCMVFTNSGSVCNEARADDSIGSIQYNVRMADSFGRNLIQNLIPFRLAFSALTRGWEVENALMDPKSFITAYLRKDLPFQGAPSPGQLTQAMISVVGHRVVVGS